MTWEIKKGCMGVPELASARHAVSSFPPEALSPGNGIPDLTAELYNLQRHIIQDALWPNVRLLPGAARLVRHLAKHNIPMAVATGSRRSIFYLKSQSGPDSSASAGGADDAVHSLDKIQVFQLFGDNIVCADDERLIPLKDGATRKMRGKPSPDVFLVAAEQALGRRVGFEEKVTSQQAAKTIKALYLKTPSLVYKLECELE